MFNQCHRHSQKKIVDCSHNVPHTGDVMNNQVNTLSRPRRAITQRKAAKILGVNHCFLNRVIKGKLPNPKLLADYNFLVARATELKTPTAQPSTPPTP